MIKIGRGSGIEGKGVILVIPCRSILRMRMDVVAVEILRRRCERNECYRLIILKAITT